MSNLFDQFAGKMRGSPFVIWIIFLTIVMFAIGVLFFAEDTISSRNGIAQLETVFGVKPVNFHVTYWALSLAPQVAQVVLFYLYLTDKEKNKWALFVAFIFLALDFASDLQDRSDGRFLPLTGGMNLDAATAVAGGFTLLFYTIGSELFVSVSIGLFLVLIADGITQYAIVVVQIKNAWKQAKEKIEKAHGYNTNQGSHSDRPYRDSRSGGRYQAER